MMGSGFGFGFSGLGMVLVWIVIIGAVVLLIRAFAGGASGGGNSARHLLDERFARGEIDREEYEEKRRLLSEHPEARGLAVPGMPPGSPGMETPNPEHYPQHYPKHYQVLLIGKDGSTSVFAEH